MRKMVMIAVLTVMVTLAAACGGGSTTPKAKFTVEDIVRLTQQQLGESGMRFPPGAIWERCISASFRPDTDMWVVTCTFSADQAGTQVVETRSYTVSDKDGRLVQ